MFHVVEVMLHSVSNFIAIAAAFLVSSVSNLSSKCVADARTWDS